jgi:hypothetical protein
MTRLIVFALIGWQGLTLAAGNAADPAITFDYSDLFDNICYAAVKTPTNADAV